jgi:hypothetical protein
MNQVGEARREEVAEQEGCGGGMREEKMGKMVR